MKNESSQQISEKCSNVKLLKIRPVSAELFYAEEQRDRLYEYMMEPKETFRKSASMHTKSALLFTCFLSFPKQAVTISPKHFLKFVFIMGENIFWGAENE